MVSPILEKIKVLFTLSILFSLLGACAQPGDNLEKEKLLSDARKAKIAPYKKTVTELTPAQEAAFDALNTLQVSTDEMNRLYSTFAGLNQSCYPPDTSLTISQAELLSALQQFVASNCKNLTLEQRDELAAASVLAQEEYTVLVCLDPSVPATYERGIPTSGTWVIPNVLDQRDVVIVW